MPISKLEAARRQLDCAIRLYFDNDDLLSVHALSRSAFRVIYDLHKPDDEYRDLVEQTIRYLGWANFNAVTNFLKHADRDPLDQSEEPAESEIQIGIGFAAMLYRRLAGHLTPEMKAFHLWMKVHNPDKFPSVREPDWEFEQDYLDANEVLKDAPREVRMLTGKALLQLVKEDRSRQSTRVHRARRQSSTPTQRGPGRRRDATGDGPLAFSKSACRNGQRHARNPAQGTLDGRKFAFPPSSQSVT